MASLSVTGTVTAGTFSGSGASLTNIPGGNITGSVNATQLGGVAAASYLTTSGTFSGTVNSSANVSTSQYFLGNAYYLSSVRATTIAWSGVTSPPTTVAGYGISDAVTTTSIGSLTSNSAKTVPWGNITGAPAYATLTSFSVTTSSASGGGSLSYNNSGQFTFTPAVPGMSSTGTFNGILSTAATAHYIYGGLNVIAGGGYTGTIYAAGDITALSDASLKTNVKTIENALDTVLKLRGVDYDRIDTGEKGTGVIAQEVRPYKPELVKESANGTLSVAYQNMGGLFIESFKDINSLIKNMQTQIDSLKEEVKKLKGE